MDKRSLAALIVLNIVLLAGLLLFALTPPAAQAQLRGRGSYTMVAGEARGKSSQDVIYVFDLNRGRVVAITYESGSERMNIIGGLDFSEDLVGGALRR